MGSRQPVLWTGVVTTKRAWFFAARRKEQGGAPSEVNSRWELTSVPDRELAEQGDLLRGYSLLVIVIALSIFAIGILSIISLLPSGQQAVRETTFSGRAATIAERELTRIKACYSETDALPPPLLSGEEPDGFRWKAEIEGKDLYTVTLTVFWQKEGRERSEDFKTEFVKK